MQQKVNDALKKMKKFNATNNEKDPLLTSTRNSSDDEVDSDAEKASKKRFRKIVKSSPQTRSSRSRKSYKEESPSHAVEEEDVDAETETKFTVGSSQTIGQSTRSSRRILGESPSKESVSTAKRTRRGDFAGPRPSASKVSADGFMDDEELDDIEVPKPATRPSNLIAALKTVVEGLPTHQDYAPKLERSDRNPWSYDEEQT